MTYLKECARQILPDAVVEYYRRRVDDEEIREYERKPRIPPPEAFKRRLVTEYSRKNAIATLIETGTLHGDMVFACRHVFQQIFTVELDHKLAAKARLRFRKHPHIHLFEGDSAKVLPAILRELREPAVFWLDGHYSGPGTAIGDRDTPVEAEIAAIGSHRLKDHIVLIDDARFFGNAHYPRAESLIESLASYFPSHRITIEHDILRCSPMDAGDVLR